MITRTTVVKLKGNQQGALEITNVESPKVETIILVERKNAAHKKMHNTIIKGIESDFVRNAVYLKGVVKADIDSVNVKEVGGSGRGLLRFEPLSNVDCEELVVGDDINISDRTISDNKIVVLSDQTNSPGTGFKGKYPRLVALSGSPLMVVDDYSIPVSTVMKSNGHLLVRTDTGTADVRLNAMTPFPKPFWEGQELYITINAPFYRGSRGNITIPTGSSTVYDNGSDVVLTSGRTFRLIAH